MKGIEMIDTIKNIKDWLKEGIYKNEEHIRVCIVLRILQKLDWNIWDPREVYTEFKAIKNEDSTRVDIALFHISYSPSVFIEVKNFGKIQTDLPNIERQLRDYNRNNTAKFSIITDGLQWRLYYSQTGGEFAQKCFKSLDLLKDDTEDVIKLFGSFLSKSEILNGNAEKEATNYLKLTQRQRAMEDALPEAKRLFLEPPFQRLPEILISLLQDKGFEATEEEAESFIVKATQRHETEDIIPPTLPKLSGYLNPNSSTRRGFQAGLRRDNLPQEGTKCKFQYKGATFQGEIKNGELVIHGYGSFSSLSSASARITRTSRNGWRDWEFQLPDSRDWIVAQKWREKQK